ncbi:hypothetical protein [Vibrio breoganii]|uniref:hypothetical protein n=1 Tax=Vibrio breoganii TaxID=553239 RepID=UPI001F52EF06|nr:hypothetical protein [Vibrio breoganii]
MGALNTTATMEAKTGVILNLIQDLSAHRAGFCTLQDAGVRQHDVKLDFVAHLNITSTMEVKRDVILNLIQDLSAHRAGFCTFQDAGVRQHDVYLEFVVHLHVTSTTEVKKAITEAKKSCHPELDSGS